MKKILFVSMVLALMFGRVALPAPREMENMVLFRALGVDTDTFTASSGRSEEKSEVLTAQGEDLKHGKTQLQTRSDSTVFLGYVDHVLVGEELARAGLSPLLDQMSRDGELGLGARLWVVKGETAQAGVESGGEDGVDRRLNTLRLSGTETRTAGEIWADLLDRGTAQVPALELRDGLLTPCGWAVLEGDRLTGFLETQ